MMSDAVRKRLELQQDEIGLAVGAALEEQRQINASLHTQLANALVLIRELYTLNSESRDRLRTIEYRVGLVPRPAISPHAIAREVPLAS